MFFEYILIFKYLFLCIIVSFGLFLLSYLIVIQYPNPEKISVYECGSSPFSDSRNKFEVRFYIVAILFMIFDLEIVFLFPWIVVLNNLTFLGNFIMIIFLFILLIGFIYEWFKGALDWQ